MDICIGHNGLCISFICTIQWFDMCTGWGKTGLTVYMENYMIINK